MKPLHTQLREARQRAGLSIRGLAEIAGVSFANLGVYELHGERMGMGNVEKLCKALKVELRVLPCGDFEKMEEMILRQSQEILEEKRTVYSMLGLLANIRDAAGDPRGKLMQSELVDHIAELKRKADGIES